MANLKSLALAGALIASSSGLARAAADAAQAAGFAVGPQYDSAHVYVAPEQVEPFIASFLATFGGHSSKPAEVKVTPTASSTISEVIFSPVGFLSVFGFKTPIPYPFGEERTGYLVTDLDAAVAAARAAGAEIVVEPFPDAIGRDAVIRWPGGVGMQLYWHTTAPSYAPIETPPENRVYLSRDAADVFVRDFQTFSGGRVIADEPAAPGVEIGRLSENFRRIRFTSAFGPMTILVTDGHLPWPYGRETTGYETTDLAKTLARAKAAGAEVLDGPYASEDRQAAMVRFPGGYIAEIHSLARH